MKVYGMDYKKYENDSKKSGDLLNKDVAHSGIGIRAYLRSLKKRARQSMKNLTKKELEDVRE